MVERSYKICIGISMGTGTAASRGLAHLTSTAATTGLTSGFGVGPGLTLSLWPAMLNYDG